MAALRFKEVEADGAGFRALGADAMPDCFLGEEIWVRDVVDLTWETLRMRRFKAKLLASATSTGLERILHRAGNNWTQDRDLSRRWAARDRQAIKQVDKRLATMGLTIEAVTAETFFIMINDI
jgi:hypothetical protein